MNTHASKDYWLKGLRVVAEERLANAKPMIKSALATDEILHELQVHQIELEMQNEELRQTLVALEQSRDRYVDLYDFAPVGYLSLNTEGLIIGINLTGAKLLGKERKAILNSRFTLSIADDHKDLWYRHFIHTKKNPGTQSLELPFPSKNGETLHYHLDCQYISDGHSPPQVRIALTDVTYRKQADANLRIDATAFETQEGIIVTDKHRAMIRVNRAFSRITGYSADMVVGKSLVFLHSDAYSEDFDRTLWSTVESAGHWQGELRGKRKDGGTFPMWLTVSAITDANGAITHYVGSFTDISPLKKAEKVLLDARTTELRHAEKLAEAANAANAAKSRFLANMSHEIRTPMSGVLGMAELLLDTQLNDTQRRFADTIKRSGKYLLLIINDILDFSKIEAGRFELVSLDFNLLETVEDVLDLFAEQAHSKGLGLNARFAPGIPEGFKGDSNRLLQVLSNLVGNAVKFTDQGEIVVDVSLDNPTGEAASQGSDATPPRIRFDVRDTGVGISEEVLPRLFQTFIQGDSSTTRKYGGTGLGLVICKQLVEMMGGEISVDSCAGQGSTFSFTLPLLPATRLKPYQSSKPSGLAGRKLLIVQDNAASLDMLKNHALSWGMLVDAVASVPSALDLLGGNSQNPLTPHPKPRDNGSHMAYQSHENSGLQKNIALEKVSDKNQPPYDLILIDIKMANMNGGELGHHIKADPVLAHIPLVMVASTPHQGETANVQKAGFQAYLFKPIRKADLHQCLLSTLFPDSGLPAANKLDTASTPLLAHILLVEDNPLNQVVAEGMLQNFGCSVDIATNGREALTALEQKPYDLVLMDCMMPEMDGYEATAEIRRRQNAGQLPHFHIIAMTASAVESEREICLIAGMDDYLTKPFSTESMRCIITTWLKGAGKKQAT
jgi:PAS domain S-box-containing protein